MNKLEKILRNTILIFSIGAFASGITGCGNEEAKLKRAHNKEMVTLEKQFINSDVDHEAVRRMDVTRRLTEEDTPKTVYPESYYILVDRNELVNTEREVYFVGKTDPFLYNDHEYYFYMEKFPSKSGDQDVRIKVIEANPEKDKDLHFSVKYLLKDNQIESKQVLDFFWN